jgi:hypothetical protein
MKFPWRARQGRVGGDTLAVVAMPLAGWAWPGWLLGRSGLGRANGLGPNGKDKRFFSKNIFSAKQFPEKY